MKYCSHCGKQLLDEQNFCPNCGTQTRNSTDNRSGQSNSGNITSSLMEKLNEYVGNENHSSELNWKDLFSTVFRRHSKEEAEDIFICGTLKTTPPLDEVSSTWPKPWLYSRILLCFGVTYALLYMCLSVLENPIVVPGLVIVGSFAVPFATLVLFMEVNAFRDISFYQVIKLFMIGGGASLVVTQALFNLEIVETGTDSTWGALMIGVIEELGKAIIVYLLMKHVQGADHILQAMLVGAAVGAGFAAFESAGYAMMFGDTDVIYIRGFLAPGGHVAWAAISGAAIVIAKGSDKLSANVFGATLFWKLFIIPIILHALWDAPFLNEGILKFIALIIIVWIVVLILINMGLSQVDKIKHNSI